MAKSTINNIDVTGKRVLMRVDFNVPMKNGDIRDDRRIRMALASIRSVVDRGGRLILISHLGRPKGRGPEPQFSLQPCAERLGELLDLKVTFVTTCTGTEVHQAADRLTDGQIMLLENLRFNEAEKAGDPGFAHQLATMADIYCNDAFGTAHREHASMLAVPQAMGSKPKVAGFLLHKEVNYLSDAIADPNHPFIAILGGAKVSDKIGTINHLLQKVDVILIGGAMTYTFMAANGQEVGDSLVEKNCRDDALEILDTASRSNAKLILPTDHICGRTLQSDTQIKVGVDQIDQGWLGLDIGPATVKNFRQHIIGAKTVIWNGPMGAFEIAPFDKGTRAVADQLAQATLDHDAITIVGGGDSAAAIEAFGLADKVSHVSTGGGASLEMLEGKRFASVELLDEQSNILRSALPS